MKSIQKVALWFTLTIVINTLVATLADLPAWQPKPEATSLPFGMYVSSVATNFVQTIELREDSTFQSRFSGESHKDGEGPRWTEFLFSGTWSIEGGRIIFTYSDATGERTDSFAIGAWESKAAFLFSRPNDHRCAFVAELFTREERQPNQALQTTPMTRSVCEKTIEFGYPQRGV